jgi:hypothetical protein
MKSFHNYQSTSAKNQRVVLIGEIHGFEAHIYQAITKLIPELKDNGIENLALEYCEDESLESIHTNLLDASRNLKILYSQDKKTYGAEYASAVSNSNLLSEAKRSHFNLHSIDVNIDEYSKYKREYDDFNAFIQEEFNRVGLKHYEALTPEEQSDYGAGKKEVAAKLMHLLCNDPEVMFEFKKMSQTNFISKRDMNFANRIDQVCQASNQGLIAFIGFAHLRGVENRLAELGYTNFESYFMPELHNAKNSKEVSINLIIHNIDGITREIIPNTRIIPCIKKVDDLVEQIRPMIFRGSTMIMAENGDLPPNVDPKEIVKSSSKELWVDRTIKPSLNEHSLSK